MSGPILIGGDKPRPDCPHERVDVVTMRRDITGFDRNALESRCRDCKGVLSSTPHVGPRWELHDWPGGGEVAMLTEVPYAPGTYQRKPYRVRWAQMFDLAIEAGAVAMVEQRLLQTLDRNPGALSNAMMRAKVIGHGIPVKPRVYVTLRSLLSIDPSRFSLEEDPYARRVLGTFPSKDE